MLYPQFTRNVVGSSSGNTIFCPMCTEDRVHFSAEVGEIFLGDWKRTLGSKKIGLHIV